MVNPGWAPISVAVMFLALAGSGLADRFDHVIHSLGGASISYFFYGAIGKLPSGATGTPKGIHYLLALTSACTVALFWEFAEFASDRFMGTSLQQTVSGTILDLMFGVLGATASVLLVAAFQLLARRPAG